MDQAESLRNIIKKQDIQKPLARVITVTSGKGGVGKSNLSVNLAIALGRMNKKVIIIDADFGLANIEVMLGIRPKYNLADMMFKGKKINEIISEGPENTGFISGGSGLREMTNLSKDQVFSLMSMMNELDSLADIIIIDTGAGISDTVIELVASSSEVLLVATPEPTSITDAYALLKTLHRNKNFNEDKTKIKVIGNRVSSYEEGVQLFNKLNIVSSKFLNMHMEFLGSVPMDPNLSQAVMRQQPVSIAYPNASSSRAILDIANVLENNNNYNDNSKENKLNGISGLFSRLFKNFK